MLATWVLLAGLAPQAAAKPDLVATDHRVPSVSAHDGSAIELYVREKRARKSAQPAAAVLLVHGATIPGVPDFDLQLAPDATGLGYSLMDELAAHGYDVFSVDVQNYGGSARVACGLCVTSQVAANDIGAAVEFIRALRHVDRVNLLGWSWGATTAGLYAQQHPDRIARLVQYALYVEHDRRPERAPVEEFRAVDLEKCCRDDFLAAATDAGVFDAYAAAARKWEDRAPNGVYADVFGRMPILDATRIAVPTLLIYGADDGVCRPDQKALPDYFRDLATHDKALVIVPDAGHALLLERGRRVLYAEVERWFARAPR
jgi:pimeloyl-ACP methyl ester carboxylesterase